MIVEFEKWTSGTEQDWYRRMTFLGVDVAPDLDLIQYPLVPTVEQYFDAYSFGCFRDPKIIDDRTTDWFTERMGDRYGKRFVSLENVDLNN